MSDNVMIGMIGMIGMIERSTMKEILAETSSKILKGQLNPSMKQFQMLEKKDFK